MTTQQIIYLVAAIVGFSPLVVIGIRAAFRFTRKATQEILDCFYVARRGTMNPIQVRQEFIDTMGREPTIAEVHDLHEMIQAEHQQAVRSLLMVGTGIVGAVALFHRELNKQKGL